MPWKVKDIMSQRYEFCQIAQDPQTRISTLCRLFGISRQTGYKWLRRYQEAGHSGLGDRRRCPRYCPTRTSAEMETMIVQLRQRYPVWGPRKIRRLLQDLVDATEVPALVTVARILKRRGLSTPPPPAPDWPTVQRFAAPAPNDLWQMDLKAPLRLSDRRKIYPVGLLDDHSRFLLGLWLVPDFTDTSVLRCWIEAARQHGLPRRTLTDHGAQFRSLDEESSAFRTYLWACGVNHVQGRIAHPQTQGKIERLWRTLKTEVLGRYSYDDMASWQQCFDAWRFHYNHYRPHQELGDEPPASRYRPSERPFVEPDERQRVGRPDSLYRRVDHRGRLGLNGQHLTLGRGFSGWTVEVRPLGNGCWHVYFRDHFIREYLLTETRPCKNRGVKGGKPPASPP